MPDNEQVKKKLTTALLAENKPLPNNLDAEIAVLGCMFLFPKDTVDITTRLLNFDGSFYSQKHQLIFSRLRDMRDENKNDSIDLITFIDYLEKKGELKAVGGEETIMQIINSVATAANVEKYVDIVYENAILRKLIHTGSKIIQQSFEKTSSIKELMDHVEKEILEIGKLHKSNDPKHIKELMLETVTYIENINNKADDSLGISSGYENLDKLISGFKNSDMIVLAARPSIGKTAFALNIAANIALRSERPKKVAIFSLEMNSLQLVTRLLCTLARISIKDLRDSTVSSTRWAEIMKCASRLKKAPIYIDDSAQVDIFELRTKARRLKRDNDIDFIIIDYLQLMHSPEVNKNTSREREVSLISEGIKALAKELNIPIMVLSQLNRMAEQTGQKPKLSHLRESGAIEQDADIVALLHREREATIEATAEAMQAGMPAELIIAKHRNGETGIVKFLFLPKYTRFEVQTPISDEDVPYS